MNRITRARSKATPPKPRPVPVNSACVACGSRNVVQFEPSARAPRRSRSSTLIQCRSCGLLSPDFNRRKPEQGVQEDYVPLEKIRAQIMGDEILNAFTHQNTKQALDQALIYAQGDVALILHSYFPVVIDVFAHVVAKYGFSKGLEGVMESIRVLQTHAKSDESIVKQLVALRNVFTPTGDWVREDGEAEQEDQKKREAGLAAQRKQREEAERAEQLAIENARQAKIRAKKIALGLDPSVLRLPILIEQPPPVIAMHEHTRDIRLQVYGDYIQSYQWFFNGQAVASEELVRGVRRSMLVIPALTKRVAGEYYCICTNEDGRTSSRVCQVMIARLSVSRGLSKKLRSYPTSPLFVCGSHAITYCVGNSVVVVDTNTLGNVKIIPPMPTAKQTIAYDGETKMLATVSVASKQEPPELTLYSFDTSLMDPPLSSPFQKPIPPPPSRKGSNKRVFQAADTAPPGSVAVKSELLSSHKIRSMVKAVHAVQFFARGQLIAISDLDRKLVVWSLSRSVDVSTNEIFTHVQESDRICHVASTPNHDLLALSCRNHKTVQLFNFKTDKLPPTGTKPPQSNRLQFSLPVHRTAFDHQGFFLAAAEAGTMKSWISIVNLNSMRASKARFEAHIGKISCIQWTKKSSLLVTSGYDGYVKVWALEATPSWLISVNVDLRGMHSAILLQKGTLLAVGHTDSRLQTREIAHFNDFEASRCMQLDSHATRVQKIWKGRQTRELIAKFIKQPK